MQSKIGVRIIHGRVLYTGKYGIRQRTGLKNFHNTVMVLTLCQSLIISLTYARPKVIMYKEF